MPVSCSELVTNWPNLSSGASGATRGVVVVVVVVVVVER
jgi:hypothetical protein